MTVDRERVAVRRRRCLRATGAALTLALAGCSEGGGDDGGDGDGSENGTINVVALGVGHGYER
jgi:hypothetical protein